jgi:hypothetical protein
MPPYLSWLVLAVAAGFLVVAKCRGPAPQAGAGQPDREVPMRSATDVAHDCRALVRLVGVLIGCGWFGYGNDGGSAGRPRLEEGGETLGLELESEHGTRSADLPRTDLHVNSHGHRPGSRSRTSSASSAYPASVC